MAFFFQEAWRAMVAQADARSRFDAGAVNLEWLAACVFRGPTHERTHVASAHSSYAKPLRKLSVSSEPRRDSAYRPNARRYLEMETNW
ncbi:hypothetical protein NYD60_21815 [Burkholderia thailandensis]|nr:hypothetical protein [Burkholderia thailandensis]MBS2130590.1 hypothetical protein [Burkholderia thailandensis]MCS6502624.1 hypothetical protein [Burkholderia thailandensis]PNE72289.1 hypothetical protein A8H38_09500 [Burkholderia thailandensis]QIO13860.1 hypothetical protein G9462_17690 [Burkholderia thailandensis]QRA13308.1 hypothetical protein JMY07_25890 [Burkholderia thailandensis]